MLSNIFQVIKKKIILTLAFQCRCFIGSIEIYLIPEIQIELVHFHNSRYIFLTLTLYLVKWNLRKGINGKITPGDNYGGGGSSRSNYRNTLRLNKRWTWTGFLLLSWCQPWYSSRPGRVPFHLDINWMNRIIYLYNKKEIIYMLPIAGQTAGLNFFVDTHGLLKKIRHFFQHFLFKFFFSTGNAGPFS